MGGSSSGFFGGRADPEKVDKLAKKIRDAEAKTKNDMYEQEVSTLIRDQLSIINNRDRDAIKTHIKQINTSLSKDIEGTVNLLYGGSVAKHTDVNGISDIDVLVILNKSELKDMSPQEVKDYFYARLRETFPKTEINKGKLAITIKFSDAEVQVLPAVRLRTGYRIADSSGKQWSFIRPRNFSEELSRVNEENAFKVVPTIKLAKSIISEFPQERRLSGYHIETMATEIFSNYDGPKTHKAMLKQFFLKASEKVRSPLVDKTGQSRHVDDYLGKRDSLERVMVSDSLSRIARKMQNADGASIARAWRDILDIPLE